MLWSLLASRPLSPPSPLVLLELECQAIRRNNIMSVLIQSVSHPHNILDHERHVSEKPLVLSIANAISLPKEQVPLGLGIPLNTPHAISCSIPTWNDNFAFMAKDERVTAAMKTGYPRSFIHPNVQKVWFANTTLNVRIIDKKKFNFWSCASSISPSKGNAAFCSLR